MNTILYIVVILFCFDSLVKIPIGAFYLHSSVVLVLSVIYIGIISKPHTIKKLHTTLLKDKFVFLLLIYILAHSIVALNILVYITMLSYLLLYILLYLYFSVYCRDTNWKILSQVALTILLVTGLMQYISIRFFNTHLTLRGLDSSYYQGKENFGTRMRGFFLEPNWYGLIIYSWLYLYASLVKKISLNNIIFIAAIIGAIILSQNRLIIIFLCLHLVLYSLPKHFNITRRAYPIIAIFFSILGYGLLSFYGLDVSDRSAMARLYTSTNIVDLYTKSSFSEQIFGYGFSNWGHYSNELNFSWSNYMQDQPLTRRDNAEIYVFLFETGFVSLLIFACDMVYIARKSRSPHDSLFLFSIIISGLFYPIYTFMFYVVPFMIIRSKVINNSLCASSSPNDRLFIQN